ncbi:MAG TPA: DUF4347 domain-containing protein, partial [Desulfobulbaceae bacterium]|nr:DUF4347 domain-containing protein [Desulfobulbaceae bacterium]
MKKVRCRQTVTAPLFEELEPRLLFSADGAETLAAPVLQQEYEEPAVVAEPESPAEAAAVDQPVVARQQETAVPVAPADDLPPDPSTPEDALPDQSVPEEKATETDPKTDADTGTAADVVEATSGPETNADGKEISQPETSVLDAENGIESTPSDQAESDVADSDGESLANGDIRHELVLINDNVKDGEQLISSIEQENSVEERDIEVIILNDQQDGIAQVSDILTDRHDLDAVHIITHGSSGSLALGDDWLHTDALTAESTQITGWGNALSEDGDILLYGCSIGQGEDGRDFVDTLAQLTGADVAASIDTTGHFSMGGDWELEYASGEIEADIPVNESAQNTWNHLLNPEFRVNTTTGEIQQTSAQTGGSKQAVAMDASGNSVVVWSSWNQDNSGWGVYGQRFDTTGVAQGSEFQINVEPTQNQQWVSVAMADDGRFAATWTSENQDGTASSVYTRRFNADGSPAGSEFRVNSTTSGSQGNSAIAMNDSGAFVIVWQGNGSGDSDGIFGQRYAVDGNTVGGEFRINNTTGGLQENPAVAINSSGAF